MNLLDLLYIPLALITAPWWALKHRRDWRQRFGHATPLTPRAPGGGERHLLIHAVSVGEVSALRELVPLLARECRVIISATTDTGHNRARELFGSTCDIVRYPLDFSRSVRRFLDAIRPDAVALVELELWPNFVAECRRRDIPIAVINGRLSERSFRGYKRIKRFIGPTFASLEFAAVQDDAYAARFEAMGVEPGRCLLTGSMKWDAARTEDPIENQAPGAKQLAESLGIDRARALIVAGSTGPGEEALLHAACPPGAQLLCAPRKPERFDEAALAMPGCIRRSSVKNGALPSAGCSGGPGGQKASRFLLDTIGELRQAYSLADLVVVGRSFGDLYGSDPIEPIALGKPVVIGPAVSDFAAIVAEFQTADGIVRATRDSLPSVLRDLLADPARRAAIAARGRDCIRQHQGASERHAELLLSLLDGRTPNAAPSPATAATAIASAAVR